MAAADGTSQWITSAEARADAHELRADSQAIVVGSGTALADRPSLTVRDVDVEPARRCACCSTAGAGWRPKVRCSTRTLGPTLVITTHDSRPGAVDAWAAAGAKVELVAPGPNGQGVDLDDAFGVLGREGVLQALVEGGGRLLGAVAEGGHAQRVVAYVAPVLLGTDGAAGFDYAGPRTIGEASRYRLVDVARVGTDVRLQLEPPKDAG